MRARTDSDPQDGIHGGPRAAIPRTTAPTAAPARPVPTDESPAPTGEPAATNGPTRPAAAPAPAPGAAPGEARDTVAPAATAAFTPEAPALTPEAPAPDAPALAPDAAPAPGAADAEAGAGPGGAGDVDPDEEYGPEDARRARWTAAGTGALLTLAGLAASLMRLTGSSPAFVPAAYACGAAVCAVAALLGSRGRTRRALWLLIAGVMVMAIGDQAD